MWQNVQFPADLAIFTKESLMENLFFCAVSLVEFKCRVVSRANYFRKTVGHPKLEASK